MNSVEGVRTFAGIDAHASTCSIKAVSRKCEALLAVGVETNRESLRDALVGLPPPVRVLVESGTMAPFVRDCLEGVVDRVIACGTRENRWVARSVDKSDPADADRLGPAAPDG